MQQIEFCVFSELAVIVAVTLGLIVLAVVVAVALDRRRGRYYKDYLNHRGHKGHRGIERG